MDYFDDESIANYCDCSPNQAHDLHKAYAKLAHDNPQTFAEIRKCDDREAYADEMYELRSSYLSPCGVVDRAPCIADIVEIDSLVQAMSLTPLQLDVLRGLVCGNSLSEIARDLGVARHRVRVARDQVRGMYAILCSSLGETDDPVLMGPSEIVRVPYSYQPDKNSEVEKGSL